MTIEEFNSTRWCAGLGVIINQGIHKGQEFPITTVDFDQELIGCITKEEDRDREEPLVTWFRCESCNLKYISPPKFTTSCFIRKNTPELIEKLKSIGYIYPYPEFDENESWLICNCPAEGGEVCTGEFDGFSEDEVDLDEKLEDYGIDCGENEKLFLALASLREDNDTNQYFIGKYTGTIVLCESSSIDNILFDKDLEDEVWDKIKPEVLIKMFNDGFLH